MPPPKENDRYTFADALQWPENERAELLEGVPVMMAPPSREHQRILTEVTRQIANYLEGKKCEVYAAPFAVLPFATANDAPEDVDTMVEPDITIICDNDKLDWRHCQSPLP